MRRIVLSPSLHLHRALKREIIVPPQNFYEPLAVLVVVEDVVGVESNRVSRLVSGPILGQFRVIRLREAHLLRQGAGEYGLTGGVLVGEDGAPARKPVDG